MTEGPSDRRRRHTGLLWLAAGAGTALGCGPPPPPPPPMLRAAGTWESTECERGIYPFGTPTFRRRQITLTDTASDQTVEYFDEFECMVRTLTLRIVSTYTVGAASTTTPGAFPVDFTRQRVLITPRTPQLASFLMMMGCPGEWTANVEHEVTNADCFGYPSIATCPSERDLLSLTNGRLAYGARPTDGNAACTEDRRPTTLESMPLSRSR